MDSLTIELIVKGSYFFLAGFCAMLYGFTQQWIASKDERNLYQYFLGDLRKTCLAMSILIGSLAAALGFDFLSNNTSQQLIMLGVGIGFAVPAKFRLELRKLNNDNSS